jgi:hypothetical protein
MKTVKSVADLKRLALETGASVAVGGSKFNAEGEKITPSPKQPKTPEAPAPKPEPKVEPPAPAMQVDLTPVASAIERSQALVAQVMQSVGQALSELKSDAAPEEWEFSINRNSDGTLASIRARAVR